MQDDPTLTMNLPQVNSTPNLQDREQTMQWQMVIPLLQQLANRKALSPVWLKKTIMKVNIPPKQLEILVKPDGNDVRDMVMSNRHIFKCGRHLLPPE